MHCKSLWIKAFAKCINVNVKCKYNIILISSEPQEEHDWWKERQNMYIKSVYCKHKEMY